MYHILIQRNANALIQECCVQDDGTMLACVSFVCECAYLSLIESAEEGRTIAPFGI